MANIRSMAISGSKMTLKMASRGHYNITVTSLIYVPTKGFPLYRNTTTYIKNPSWGPFFTDLKWGNNRIKKQLREKPAKIGFKPNFPSWKPELRTPETPRKHLYVVPSLYNL